MPRFRAVPLVSVTVMSVLLPGAALAKPASVKPSLGISSAARVGKHISPPVKVSFNAPGGSPSACQGRVTVKAKVGKKTVVKHGKKHKVPVYKKKSASLAYAGGTCSAVAAPSSRPR